MQTQSTYDAFGQTATSGSANGNTSQYTGRENDGTGLYYYRARYYSPSLQRFINEDPIGLLGGINLYAYVGNDPISYSDPFGLKPKPNNLVDDAEAERQRREVEKFLNDFVKASKKNLRNIVENAAFEGLGPAIGATLKTGGGAARNAVEEWLGPKTRVIINPAGDKIFLSQDGLRRIRADFNNPSPHQNPHLHVEERIGNEWVKSGPLFPTDVPPH